MFVDLRRLIEEKIGEYKEKYRFKLSDIEVKNVNGYIEHTNLKATTTDDEIKKLCEEAKVYNFRGVCVNPSFVSLVKEELEETDVKVVTVVGFPLGATSTKSKAYEAKVAVEDGADEIDMVLHIGRLKSGDYDYVYEDIKKVVETCKKPVKVIIETCYLTDEEKIAACVISKEAGAAFVKTSTGFGSGGAKAEDVNLMRWVVGDLGVKASGGVKTFEDAVKMIRAGANSIGTSSGVSIVGK
ncbi:deoxyribose-phosphate aldolase [Thermosipho melanesiensis]|nr:deoxyribose-phosphate aldolase [Thermosipho melanesiensis]OOC38705.1 deoxyribose-phosphate aldolase [Thermosipho melanesiensis]OOC40509.1 deoxyribose-phosphate aldolase [Thermosipho melanesiensis]OOC40774.1 deoxyribose-phosphate aldolase [Thermosipho melanesiensis]OOC44620.1 deoxyribose-phosphate aldolase [Thermosipho melanesiensis]OOC45974.1 deoxyribose-phosphate aldolase [Thermosipho melanesiensis]